MADDAGHSAGPPPAPHRQCRERGKSSSRAVFLVAWEVTGGHPLEWEDIRLLPDR